MRFILPLFCLCFWSWQEACASVPFPNKGTALTDGWEYTWGDPEFVGGRPATEGLAWRPLSLPAWPSPPPGAKVLWQRVRLPEFDAPETTLALEESWQNFQVYIEGEKIFEVGTWGATGLERWRGRLEWLIPLSAYHSGQQVYFRFASDDPFFGVHRNVYLGHPFNHLYRAVAKDLVTFCIASFYFGVGIFVLLGAIILRRETVLFVFSVFMIVLGIYPISSTGILGFFNFDPYIWNTVEQISGGLVACLFLWLSYLIFGPGLVKSLKIAAMVLSTFLFYAIAESLLTQQSMWRHLAAFQPVFAVCLLSAGVNSIYFAIRERRFDTILFLIGTAFNLSAFVHDLLVSMGKLSESSHINLWTTMGYVTMMGVIVVHRYIQRMREADRLSFEKSKLDHENRIISTKNREISLILDNVHQGLLTLNRKGAVEPAFSAYLPQLLEVDAAGIAGKLGTDLIFKDSEFTSDQRHMFEAIIDSSLNNDEINWLANGSSLPTELVISQNGRTKQLDIDWLPILGEGSTIDRILVSLHDRSAEKALAAQLEAQQREVDAQVEIIRELIPTHKSVLSRFLRSTSEDLATAGTAAVEKDNIRLMRALHTVKGNSRMIGLKSLAQLAHEAEDVVRATSSAAELVTAALDPLNRQFARYRSVATDILGTQSSLDHAASNLHGFIAANLGAFESRIKASGRRLGRLACSDGVMVWPETVFAPLASMLVHAINNSIDHGYLLPRLARPIDIELTAAEEGAMVLVCIADRGRGIDFEALREKARQLGLSFDGDPTEVLFLDGVSTAEQVSETSGRGVGTAAIRSTIRALGGEVKIRPRDLGGTTLEIYIPTRLFGRHDRAA